MKNKTSKINLAYVLSVLVILCSCQNKELKSGQNFEEIKKINSENIFDLFNSGEYNKFIELAEAEWSNSKDKSKLLVPLSIAYSYAENFEKGLFYSNEMLKLEPENYQALFYKANCFLYLEKIDSAEYCYKKVLEINPYYARANLNLAQVYLVKGDNQNAISQYIYALELFHKNKFKEEVILYSKRVLEIEPNNKIAKKYLELYQ